MTDQWQELKETIVELRDGDGTGTQQEVCKFLANYMDILEKQMQQPCKDAIGREDMLDAIGHGTTYTSEELQRIIKGLPPVTPQPKMGCEGCTYEKTGNNSTYPCSHCSRCYTDKYKAERSDKWHVCPIENKKPENIREKKEYVEWLPQYEGKWEAESEE